MTDTNGWTEYKKLVIAELERLSDGIEANAALSAQMRLDINSAAASIRAETTAIASRIAIDKMEDHSKIRQEYNDKCACVASDLSTLRARVERIETEKNVAKEVKTDAKSETKNIWAYIIGSVGLIGSVVSLILVLTECTKAAI